jgi:large subunit ribosomal protein L15
MALKYRKIRRQHRGTRICGRGKKGPRVRDGGRGMAGTHKHKYTWVTAKCPDYFGAESMHGAKKVKAVNVGYLNGLAVSTGKSEVDAISLGFQKVLGGGEVTKAITVKAKLFTAGAKEKIEAAGGKALTV